MAGVNIRTRVILQTEMTSVTTSQLRRRGRYSSATLRESNAPGQPRPLQMHREQQKTKPIPGVFLTDVTFPRHQT